MTKMNDKRLADLVRFYSIITTLETLHDETDFCDVVVKPAVYEQYRTLVNKSKFLRVHGKLSESRKRQGARSLCSFDKRDPIVFSGFS